MLHAQGCSYVLKEAAILIESGAHEGLDALIVVEADRAVRLERISGREDMDIQKAEARMEQQMSNEERRVYADHIIVNDGHSPSDSASFEATQELAAVGLILQPCMQPKISPGSVWPRKGKFTEVECQFSVAYCVFESGR